MSGRSQTRNFVQVPKPNTHAWLFRQMKRGNHKP